MEKVNDTQKITRQLNNSKRESTDEANSANASSGAFRQALLHTQTKYADIIKALEDK